MISKKETVSNLINLSGRNAIVIGGAGYLGSEISMALAECGARVFVCSRDLNKCKKFVAKLKNNFPNNHIAYEVDITSTLSLKKIFKKISKETNGKVHTLVNCGWSGKKNTFESIDLKDWQNDIDVSLTGVFNSVKIFVPLLKKTEGNILNIASMYGHVAPDYRIYDSPNLANPPSYGAAKAGVIQFTKYLSSFLAPHQIRVNSISPGPFPFPETQKENKKFIKRLSQKVILNRIGQPYELKGISLLLCSDAGSFINGQNISVDGGWTTW